MHRGPLTIGAALVALLTLACSSGDDGDEPGSEAESASTTASVGSVDVAATWSAQLDDPPEEYPPGEYMLIELALDTHSGDLSSVNLVEASRLRVGTQDLEPETWLSESDEAHHRSGLLVFRRVDLTLPVTLTVELEEGTAELFWDELPDG